MASPNVTWGGLNLASMKEQTFIHTADNIIEYVETWNGNKHDTAWPNYAPGGTATVEGSETLTWYSVESESGKNKALSSLTAKASNKFNVNRAKWSMEQALESVTYRVLPDYTDTNYDFSAPFLAPVVTATLFSIEVPNLATDTPNLSDCPFTYSANQPYGVEFHNISVTYGWVQTKEPQLTSEGWQIVIRWRWMVISSS